jgi:hypothetical protein
MRKVAHTPSTEYPLSLIRMMWEQVRPGGGEVNIHGAKEVFRRDRVSRGSLRLNS